MTASGSLNFTERFLAEVPSAVKIDPSQSGRSRQKKASRGWKSYVRGIRLIMPDTLVHGPTQRNGFCSPTESPRVNPLYSPFDPSILQEKERERESKKNTDPLSCNFFCMIRSLARSCRDAPAIGERARSRKRFERFPG